MPMLDRIESFKSIFLDLDAHCSDHNEENLIRRNKFRRAILFRRATPGKEVIDSRADARERTRIPFLRAARRVGCHRGEVNDERIWSCAFEHRASS